MKIENYLSDFEIDLNTTNDHYLDRKGISQKLKKLIQSEKKEEYVNLALGISDHKANYSASEHGLGEHILDNNKISSIYKLAKKFMSNELKVKDIPKIIYETNLPFLKISVGSEMATLLQPNKFWVGNTRTIWSHLVIKHKGSWEKANEELKLYQNNETPSEMEYKTWRDIYPSMKDNLETIYKISELWANEQNVKIGKEKYIWIDAICNSLYECK
jgi:hypothetical protein